MLPTPRLFRSRWAALAWAAGIVWMAVEVASTAPSTDAQRPAGRATDATGAAVNQSDLAVLAAAMAK